VVGIAGGPEKCLWAQEALGFDDCIDHRAMDVAASLRAACPNGIDVYFENVGGLVQAVVFPLLNAHGRAVMCGMVSEYNDPEPSPGPNLMAVVRKRLRIEGLIVSDKPERFAEWRALAAPWVADGSLRYRETIVDGLENAPDALAQVLGGGNFGKMVVKVG
jgi:NADPH-dependent curcumin reductase CurA